jgi:hypothetical protein
MQRIFRTSTKYWFSNGSVFPFGLLLTVLGFWLFSRGYNEAIKILVLAPFALWRSLFTTFLPSLKNFVQIDAQGISGFVAKAGFSVTWPSLVAAEMRSRGYQPYLELTTDERNFTIPLQQFDHKEIWRLVQQYAPPRALQKDAYQRASWYQRLMHANTESLKSQFLPLHVINKEYLLPGILTTIICLGLAYFAWHDGSTAPALFLIVVSLLGFYLVAQTGIITVDEQGITYRVAWGSNAINWDEIRSVKQDVLQQQCLLQGTARQLKIPGPKTWLGSKKVECEQYFNAQLNIRNLRVEDGTNFK